MKVFIDLGAYGGDTLEMALSYYPNFDKYIGFEPVPDLASLCKKKFSKNSKVEIANASAGECDQEVPLYMSFYAKETLGYGKGCSYFAEKTTGHLDKNVFVMTSMLDFSDYLIKKFNKDDFIVLKSDIEGKEYDLFEHLLETGAIEYINKIYCEWHVHKMPKVISKDRHKKLINDLRQRGYKLKGKYKSDDFKEIVQSKTKKRKNRSK